MKIPLNYSGKTINVSPYCTDIERDILIYNELVDVPSIDGILDILKDCIHGDVENLTRNEKVSVLWKLRSISIGEEIGVKWQCQECKSTQDAALNISEVIIPGDNLKGINDQFKDVTLDNLHEFVSVDVNELELEEFDALYKRVKENITRFDFIKNAKCLTCGSTQPFDISDDKYISECLSEDTIASIYQTMSDLVFFGKYTIACIDSMKPFERSVFVGILNKTREDLNK